MLVTPSYAQTVIQKETTMAQLDTLQLDRMQNTATAEIRPFHINVPEEALVDLRRRLEATRWPDQETVPDRRRACSWRR